VKPKKRTTLFEHQEARNNYIYIYVYLAELLQEAQESLTQSLYLVRVAN
jgi:hypothetical protein